MAQPSCIILCHTTANVIGQCIFSAFNQSFTQDTVRICWPQFTATTRRCESKTNTARRTWFRSSTLTIYICTVCIVAGCKLYELSTEQSKMHTTLQWRISRGTKQTKRCDTQPNPRFLTVTHSHSDTRFLLPLRQQYYLH